MSNDKLVYQVIPLRLLEDRKVTKVMLQPASLCLKEMSVFLSFLTTITCESNCV